jgi:hypothetical protein
MTSYMTPTMLLTPKKKIKESQHLDVYNSVSNCAVNSSTDEQRDGETEREITLLAMEK